MYFSITESEEEAFFDRHFDCGDDEETSGRNARTSLELLKEAYDAVKKISELAEDGEYFDEAEAKLSFQKVALAKGYFKRFLETCSTDTKTQLSEEMEKIALT